MAINSNTNNKCCSIALDCHHLVYNKRLSIVLSHFPNKNTESCPLHLFYRTYWKSFLFTFLESFDFQINLFSRTDRWLYFKTCLRIISSLLSILTFPRFCLFIGISEQKYLVDLVQFFWHWNRSLSWQKWKKNIDKMYEIELNWITLAARSQCNQANSFA